MSRVDSNIAAADLVSPSFAMVEALPSMRGTVTLEREILADLDTPVSAYLKIRGDGPSFLLESVEGGEHVGRYSFIGNGSWLYRVERASDLPGSGHAEGRDPQPDGGLVEMDLGEERGLDGAGRIPSDKAHARSRRALPNVLAPLRARLDAMRPVYPVEDARFAGGVLGYLSYEAVQHVERVPVPDRDVLCLPDGLFMGVDTLLVFDRVRHSIRVLTHMPLDGPRASAYRAAVARVNGLVARLEAPLPDGKLARPGLSPREATVRHTAARAHELGQPDGESLRSNVSREEFADMVRAAQEYICAGDILQVVLSQRLSMPLHGEPFEFYRRLRSLSPSPYLYFLDFGDHQIVGASPELLLQVENGTVATRPIAGTRRRGHDVDEDRALAAELLADEKERAEHIMLVDLARNDVGRVCVPGSVEVGTLMEVERFSHVMHIVSDVTGTLRSDRTSEEALWAAFPAGTVSGAPKVRAMQVIAELEPDRRGPYAGAVGFLTPAGNLEFAITIRTAVIKDGLVHVQAGAGIVADSVPEREYEETMNKARALLLAAAHCGER